MNRELLDPVVRAVLYEGFILYPYRPSLKNTQRWTFGGLYPPAYIAGQRGGADSSCMRTECLIRGNGAAEVEIVLRFLHLIERTLTQRIDGGPAAGGMAEREMPALEIDGRRYLPWQEAQEREMALPMRTLAQLMSAPVRMELEFPARTWSETLTDSTGRVAGAINRRQESVRAAISADAVRVGNPGDSLYRLRVAVANATAMGAHRNAMAMSRLDAGENCFGPAAVSREEALRRSLVSTHTLLGCTGGRFLSLTDPPASAARAAAECRNQGTWPALIGAAGESETVLSSPIILEDHPHIAPESPGDFFDGTEIDEMLTLRILTLTDDENRDMEAVDPAARAILERTLEQSAEHMMALHGVLREPGG